MPKNPLILTAGAAIAVTVWVVVAQGTKIEMNDLPPAVHRAVLAEISGAEIVGLVKEEDNGRTLYEVETTLNGRTRALKFSADGQLLEAEEVVAEGKMIVQP